MLRLTGLTRIHGRFENLAHGQPVTLFHDGTLAAWGANHLGQLGNGGTTHASSPALVDTSGVSDVRY